MKNALFAILLLAACIASYSLGKKNGASSLSQITPLPIEKQIQKVQNTTPIPSTSTTKIRPPAPDPITPAQRGYAAAQSDLDDALKALDAINPSDRAAYISGIMSFAAKNLPPADALKLQQKVPEALRPNALRSLVSEWIYNRSPLDEDTRAKQRDAVLTRTGGREGLEVELSAALASARPDPELMNAWLDNFSKFGARSEILATFSSQFPRENPDALFARTQDWTPWEKERVTRRFIWNWATENPNDAWNWYQSQHSQFDGDLSSSILNPWAAKDPDAVKALLNQLQDPTQRRLVVEIIGRNLAQKNTADAVTWADSLANPNERSAAQQAVYDGSPRGIGAVLDLKNGFPTLRGIVPGSPLEQSGIKPGDQFLEARLPDGTTHGFFGQDLATSASLIRGEPGSSMTLRILRQNGETGAFEEHLIPITRAQLYLNEKTLPK